MTLPLESAGGPVEWVAGEEPRREAGGDPPRFN